MPLCTAGIESGYTLARTIITDAGRTYYLASRLLPPPARRAVFALYGFARMVDDVVDSGDHAPREAAAEVTAIETGLAAALSGQGALGDSGPLTVDQQSLLAALADTVDRFAIDPATFAAFLHSMRMDIPGTPQFRNRYDDFAALSEYTYGSAAVIGLQMLPVLGASRPTPETTAGAALLGEAFQLTNFLRDVAEDLARDRIYLPADALAAFGVDEERLRADAAARRTSPQMRRALAHLIAINRDQYRRTAGAIAALPARTRPAIAAAASSYSAILTEIEASGYDVMARRAVVPTRRRLAHAARAALA